MSLIDVHAGRQTFTATTERYNEAFRYVATVGYEEVVETLYNEAMVGESTMESLLDVLDFMYVVGVVASYTDLRLLTIEEQAAADVASGRIRSMRYADVCEHGAISCPTCGLLP